MGPLISLFWASGDVCLGFKARVDPSFACYFTSLPDSSSLVQHLLASWKFAWQLILTSIGRPRTHKRIFSAFLIVERLLKLVTHHIVNFPIVPECRPGEARNSTTDQCYRCPRGTYTNVVESQECTSCPEGQTTLFDRSQSDSCYDSKEIVICFLHFEFHPSSPRDYIVYCCEWDSFFKIC